MNEDSSVRRWPSKVISSILGTPVALTYLRGHSEL